MSLPPLLLQTDTQADTPGSPFIPSPICFHSPQPSPISPLTVKGPEDADFLWHGTFSAFQSESDLLGIPSYSLDGDVVEHQPVSPDLHLKSTRTLVNPYCWQPYDSYTPSTLDLFPPSRPSISEFDGGSTPSLSTSPLMLSPVSTRSPDVNAHVDLYLIPRRCFGHLVFVDAAAALALARDGIVAPRVIR